MFLMLEILTNYKVSVIIHKRFEMRALVAQLDRVTGYELYSHIVNKLLTTKYFNDLR